MQEQRAVSLLDRIDCRPSGLVSSNQAGDTSNTRTGELACADAQQAHAHRINITPVESHLLDRSYTQPRRARSA